MPLTAAVALSNAFDHGRDVVKCLSTFGTSPSHASPRSPFDAAAGQRDSDDPSCRGTQSVRVASGWVCSRVILMHACMRSHFCLRACCTGHAAREANLLRARTCIQLKSCALVPHACGAGPWAGMQSMSLGVRMCLFGLFPTRREDPTLIFYHAALHDAPLFTQLRVRHDGRLVG